MQPPVAFDRAAAKAAGYSDAEIDAYLASQSPASIPAAPTTVSKPQPKAVRAKTETTLGEDVVGMTRAAMNKLTFGQYPRLVGKVASLGGANAEEEAKRLGEYIAQYQQMAPGKSQVAETVGEVAPYLAGIGGAFRAAPATRQAASAIAKGYGKVLQSPLGRLLPSSVAAAGEIAAIEGIRGAAEAAPDDSRLAAALSRAGMALPFGKAGEVVGTYAAGKFGPTLSQQSAKAEAAMQKAGEQINRYREEATVELTPALAKLYERSKPLREAVNTMAESLGLPATDPKVLATAYSQLTADASPVFRKEILTPFLTAIDGASTVPLSPGIKAYAKAASAKTGAEAGMKTGQYLRTGAGNPLEVGPEVMVGRQTRAFVSPEQRQAAAQALVASIGESRAPVLQQGILQSLLTQGRGVGKIAETAERLGGTPSFTQAMLQRTGRGFGASR